MRRHLAAAVVLAALAACDVSIGSRDNGSGNASGEVSGTAAPAMARFVNSRENARSANLQQHYVDFSFEYPPNWVITPQPTDGSASIMFASRRR